MVILAGRGSTFSLMLICSQLTSNLDTVIEEASNYPIDQVSRFLASHASLTRVWFRL